MDAPEVDPLPRELVFVDLETTGCDAARHRITEIGLVRVVGDVVIEEWSSLVNPECPIPENIASFTGITNEMVEGAPRFGEIAREVLARLKPAGAAPVFAAHNARFDYGFLRAEFRRAGIAFAAPVLCTVKLSRRLFPEHARHSLDAVMERHGLVCGARHRALGDARVLSEFWAKLRREIDEPRLAAALGAARSAVRLPQWLPEGLADELPEGPGVYRFHGADGAPLYVGKSRCLRGAVLAHLTEEHPGRERGLTAEVRRVEWVETAGELGAALRELADLRNLEPRYNRRAQRPSEICSVRLHEPTGGIEVVALEEVGPDQLGECFGVFQSRKDARKALLDIARAKELCLKLLGLEEAPDGGSCLAHQVGHCKGACVGREPPLLHALRVRMALSALKLKAWPFPGRVALVERTWMGSADLHVLDHWTYIGTAHCDEELEALSARRGGGGFDPQLYRILVRHLAHHPKLEWRDLERAGIPDHADVR